MSSPSINLEVFLVELENISPEGSRNRKKKTEDNLFSDKSWLVDKQRELVRPYPRLTDHYHQI